MRTRGRMAAIRLLERGANNPGFLKEIGVTVTMRNRNEEKAEHNEGNNKKNVGIELTEDMKGVLL